ncbi:MAG TPA: glycosyltransferase [Anaerolineaceae bacterium]
MRVLYFTRDYTPHDHRFLTSLAESGQEVYYLRLERRGRQLEDRSLPPAVKQVAWRGGQKPFRWRDLPALLASLRNVLREVRPDVLHAGPVQTAGFLAALSGFRPLVTMSWGSDLLKDADRSAAYRWITRFTLKRSTVLAGDCQAVADKAAAFGFPRERAFLFPWGIDLARFSPGSDEGFRARLGWQDCFVVLSLRSWEPVYGVDVMLRGFATACLEAAASKQAAGAGMPLRLLLLGGGSQAAMVHRIIQENNLQNVVYLGGQVNQEDLPRMYRSADLYASASHSDGSSVSLMEALGSGLPALVTDIPSNREWVTPGQEGWLFPDSDPQAVAEGILRAQAQTREARDTMRRAARARAEACADWQKNFQVLLRAYETAQKLAQE